MRYYAAFNFHISLILSEMQFTAAKRRSSLKTGCSPNKDAKALCFSMPKT